MPKKKSTRIKYVDAPDLMERTVEIVNKLKMHHVDLNRVGCLRSTGSTSKRTIARCHTLGKVMQRVMKSGAYYAIEFLEPFEKMSKKEQDKVIIHELLHIPKTFGGGFRHHDYVCDDTVNAMYEKLEGTQDQLNRYF